MKPGGIYVLLSFPMILGLVLLLTGYNGLYGQDSYAYLKYSKQVLAHFHGGVFPRDFFWPVAYPVFGAVVALVFGHPLMSMLLVTLIASTTALYFTYKILSHFAGEKDPRVWIYLILFYLPSPFLFRTSLSIMSDLMAIACILGAVFFCLQYAKEPKGNFLWAYVVFISLAVITRYAAAAILLPFDIWMGVLILKNKKWLQAVAAMIVAFLILSIHLYFKSGAIQGFYTHEWLSSWSPLNFFSSEFLTSDGLHQHSYPNLVKVFSVLLHPGFVFTGALFLGFMRRGDFQSVGHQFIWAALIFYLCFLAGMPIQNDRFLLLAFPLVIILYYPAFLRLISVPMIRKAGKILIPLVLMIQIGFLLRALLPQLTLNRNEKKMAKVLKEYPTTTLYTSGVEGLLDAYGVAHHPKSIYSERYRQLEVPCLVLLNPGEIEKQWQEKTPGWNWDLIKNKYQKKLLRKFEGGWNLYEIR